MSPEQAAGSEQRHRYAQRFYSLGVLLYELLYRPAALRVRNVLGAGIGRGETTGSRRTGTAESEHEISGRDLRLFRFRTARRTAAPWSGHASNPRRTRLDRDESDRKRTARAATTPRAISRRISSISAGEAVEAGAPSIGYRVAKYVRRHRLALGGRQSLQVPC